MALATTVPFSKFRVYLGNGASPEVFGSPCGLTANAIRFSKATNSTVVPDCTNPDLPAWEDRDVVSQSASIDGSGVLATESLATWWNAYNSTATVNARVDVEMPSPAGGYWQGAFHLVAFEPGGTRGNRSTVTIRMDSDGAVTWTATP
jgi:predicted secreted protein